MNGCNSLANLFIYDTIDRYGYEPWAPSSHKLADMISVYFIGVPRGDDLTCPTAKPPTSLHSSQFSLLSVSASSFSGDQNEGSTPPDDPSLSRLGIPDKDGLSIVSHGNEIAVDNETAVIELIEQFVQENYDYWFAMGSIQVREAAQNGVAIQIHYNPARELICPPAYDRPNATVLIDRIYVTIPDQPDKKNKLYYYVSPVRDGDLDHTILLPIETANELLKLIGEDPIPQNPLFGL